MRSYPVERNVFQVGGSQSNILSDPIRNGDIKAHLSLNNFESIRGEDLWTTTRGTPSKPTALTEFAQKRNSYLLWITTPVAASFSVAVIIAALAGPQWLLTEEKIPNVNYNGTSNYNLKDDGVYITKSTKSSLWILCAYQGDDHHCSTIDYFPDEEYNPDPNDSTMAIPYTIIRSSPFFLFAGLLLIISYTLLMLTMCTHQKTICYFTAGILFIITGLLMLIGLIVYISIFKAEIGYKLRPKSSLQSPLFTFRYGQSFFLYVLGFITTEIVGVLNIFLYIALQHVGREKVRAIPCFVYNKVRENSTRTRKMSNTIVPPSSGVLKARCQKHPPVPNTFFSPISHRRFYFEKPKKTVGHDKNLTKSLNELYTSDPTPMYSSFDIVNEYPLTRSVSTTTDIFSNIYYNEYGDNSLHNRGNLSHSGSVYMRRTISSSSDGSAGKFCGLSRKILNAGCNPRSKDIYFIDPDMDANVHDEMILSYYEKQDRKRQNNPTNIYHPKSLCDLEARGNDVIFNKRVSNYFHKNEVMGREVYQSRTLPRDFMKKNVEFADEFYGKRRTSASGLMFNEDLSNRRRDAAKRREYFQKSHELLASNRDNRYKDSLSVDDSAAFHWPSRIPSSPSALSNRSHFRIPSISLSHHDDNPTTVKESPVKSEDSGTFDLEKIEKERRESHANLFNNSSFSFDVYSGTPV